MPRTSLASALAVLVIGTGGSLAPAPPRKAATAPATFTSVVAGEYHTCAIANDSTAYCWGLNHVAQLGSASAEKCKVEGQELPCSTRPLAVAAGLKFASLAVGSYHSCGLVADGQLYCWGENTTGQLGALDSDRSQAPVPVGGELRFSQLTLGSRHTCALTQDDVAYCWGRNDYGQLGSDSAVQSCTLNARQVPCQRAPVRVESKLPLRLLSAGFDHTCGLTTSGQTFCWGRGRDRSPSEVQGREFVALSAGGPEGRTCGLLDDGLPYCWGHMMSTLGIVTFSSPELGGQTAADAEKWFWRFTQLSTGGFHMCGVTPTGIAYCWGLDEWGQLGTGKGRAKIPVSETPVAVAGALQFRSVGAGFSHTCGVTTGGVVYCWGENNVGQLGDGTTKNRNRPTALAWEAAARPR